MNDSRTQQQIVKTKTASQVGELSVKLADAALIARDRGDDVHALFFAVKAAETLALAKALGWSPSPPPQEAER